MKDNRDTAEYKTELGIQRNLCLTVHFAESTTGTVCWVSLHFNHDLKLCVQLGVVKFTPF